MRHLTVAFVVFASMLGAASPAAAQSTDGVAALLLRIEEALVAGQPGAYAALVVPSVGPERVLAFTDEIVGGPLDRAVVRERDRAPLPGTQPGEAFRLLVDVFVEFGAQARISTFRLEVVRAPAAPGGEGDEDARWLIKSQERVNNIQGLYRLALDTSKQYAVRNLTLRAEDLVITVPSGSAFVAETDQGPTAIVVVGAGTMRFSPAPETERGQLRMYFGREVLEAAVSSVFLRVNPGSIANTVDMSGLTERQVDARDLRLASQIFAAEVGKSFVLDLSDLSRDTWSLVPNPRDVLFEIRTRKHRTLTYARSTSEPEDITLFERDRRHSIALYPSAAVLAARGPYYDEDALADVDVTEHDVAVTYSPERNWFDAQARLRLRVRAVAVPTVTLRLNEAFTVRSVTSLEHGRLLALRVKGQNNLLIGLPATVLRGSHLTLTISYVGRLAPLSPDREVLALDSPQQNILQPDDGPVVTPEARFTYSHRSWWYPQATVGDYGTARLRITVPAAYDVVASGDPAGDRPQLGGGTPSDPARRTFVFHAGQPVRYLAFIVSRLQPAGSGTVTLARDQAPGASPPGEDRAPAGQTGRLSTGVFYDALDLSVLANPRQVGRGREYLATASEILRLYTSLLDDVPYPSLALTLLDNDRPGGHSPAYMGLLYQPLPTTSFTWRNDPVTFEGFPQFFLAHELAHQFWGQAVGWKSYHEQWISEGFAQYFAALYLERSRGGASLAALLRQMRRSVQDHAGQGPVFLGYRLAARGDSQGFRAVVYNKGALVLHMLRRLVGDGPFFTALRTFYRESRFTKVGTEEFRRVVERETGRDLERFFRKWMLETAIPTLGVSYAVSAGEARVVVEQPGEPFDLPLTLSVIYVTGERDDVLLAVTDSRVERVVPLRGQVRTIEANVDSGALAQVTVRRLR